MTSGPRWSAARSSWRWGDRRQWSRRRQGISSGPIVWAPVPVDQWAAFFAEVERLVGGRLEGRDAVHLFRLPMGVNTKPGRGGFAVRLVEITTSVLNIISPPNSPLSSGLGPSSGPEPGSRT